jgi:hypothetical protein
MPLFAQFQPQPNNGPPDEFMAIFIGVVCVALVVGLVILILYLLTLSKALSRCRPANRTMEPGQVWLNLIPLFNIVWQFITVTRVAESLKNEFYDRGWDDRGDFGKSVGTAYCVLNLAGFVPFIGGLFSLAGFVCFIIYWVKIAGHSKELAGDGGGYNDYDDRPRKRRSRDDDYDDYDDDYDRR